MAVACREITNCIPEIVLPGHRMGLIQVRPYRMPRGWRVRPHAHSHYEISVILDGSARDDRPPGQVLGPGHVFFHAPHTLHSWRAPVRSCLRLIMWFTVDPPLPVAIPDSWPCWPWLLHDIARLMRHAVDRQPGWPNQAAAGLAVVLAQALTLAQIPATAAPAFARTDPLLTTVDSFLEDNYIRSVSLQDVATCAGVSISSLVHRYRHLAGMTVTQRLTTIRLEQAGYLLKETDLPLKTICARVGVVHPAYLCRLFRRYYGKSPSAFRHASRA